MKETSEKLAIMGGAKAITKTFKTYNSIGVEEVSAVTKIVEGGVLSKFLGCWDDDFYGGKMVQEFEASWKNYFNVKHAVSVNSATSGLIAALGAIGLEPGDEVIVSPWTMCASATSILIWNAIPVFADIEPETFNIDPRSIEDNITSKTKAIVVPDIFGHPADLDAIMNIAKVHDLKVIEDAAQAPGAKYKNNYVGTVADIGVFSLNYHKHIHTGEGGVCVTNDPELAKRMQLIRNHGEAVVEGMGEANLINMMGFNFRLGEIEAAIGIEQLKKLDNQINKIITIANRLSERLCDFPGLKIPVVKKDCTHIYYGYPIIYDENITGVPRDMIIKALSAEGVDIGGGYQNIHLLPLFQNKIAYGSKGFPWYINGEHSNVSYEKGICPTAEKLHDESLLIIPMCLYELSNNDADLMIHAFKKTWSNLNVLKGCKK